MPNNRFSFTDSRLRMLLPSLGGKRQYFYDEKTPGLRLQVTPSGTKSFQFQARGKRQSRIVTTTLGRYPTLPIHKAREKATELMSATIDGEDVEERIRSVRQEMSFAETFHLWLEQHAKPHKKSWEEDVSRFKLYMEKPFGNNKLSWFTTAKIRKWHLNLTGIKKQRGKDGATISASTANRALALLSTVFNQMLPERPNPCKGVKKFRELSRDRFLQPAELQQFFAALEHPDTPDDLKDYLLISIYTGARRGNVLSMRWSDVNWDRKIWHIPADQSKNAEPIDVPLIDQAVRILRARKSKTSSVFVFASRRSKSGHIEEPKKAWKSLLKRAELTDIRIHDLRRTLGSYQTMTGASTTVVGKTLGHKSPAATAVYARLNLDPIRESIIKAVEAMETAKNMPSKIVNIEDRNG